MKQFLGVITCMFIFLLAVKGQEELGINFYQLNEQQGLSNNHVNTIFKDKDGFLWFGTDIGLNRYDGQEIKVFRHSNTNIKSLDANHVLDLFTGPQDLLWVKTTKGLHIYDAFLENFNRNTDSVLATYGIPGGNILNILKDPLGNYWFLHETQGLYVYHPTEKSTARYRISQEKITSITLMPNHKLALVYEHGLLEEIDIRNLKTQFKRPTAEALKADYQLFADKENGLWIYAKNLPTGIYYLKDPSSPIEHFHQNSSKVKLNTDMISHIAEDQDGLIWLATDHGGINLLNKKDWTIHYLLHEDQSRYSLAQNSTTILYKDDQEIIWVGTYKQGISYHHKKMVLFQRIDRQTGLPFEDVNRFVEDAQGNLWIGTNGGGLLHYNRKSQHFTSYLNNPTDPRSLSSNIIVSLLLDKKNQLWVGSYHGGIQRFDGQNFIPYNCTNNQAKETQDTNIWEIYQDTKGQIWVGTLNDGLYYYLPDQDQFKKLEDPAIPSYISAVREDHLGQLWIGGATGIVVLNQQHKVIQEYDINHGLNNNYIADILEDQKQQIWIATQDGLHLYQPSEKQKFVDITRAGGLPDQSILSILEGDNGDIWASTLKGLICLSYTDEKQIAIKRYGTADGLQSLSFNENASLKTKKGELIFGGPAGFNFVIPKNIPILTPQIRPVVTSFSLFNRPIAIGEKYQGSTVLDASPIKAKKIHLQHNQNVFSLTFSALDYLTKEHTQFVYQLKGFHETWLPDDGQHRATFTNLDPGDYEFQIKASLGDGKWSKPYSLLHIAIAPPIWKTTWAYSLYIAVLISILLLIRHIEKQRQKSRFLLQQQREETKKQIEIEHLKTRFFTNISHEFRTPISLILAPIDTLLEEQPTASQKNHLLTMKRNAKRLLNLLNQLLDLKKVNDNKLKAEFSLGDILAQIKDHVESFTDLATKKQIHLTLEMDKESLYTYFDQEKLERILFNLLGNAFKFTPEKGHISVIVEVLHNSFPHYLQITVKDTGIGISKEVLPNIFERYFQHTGNIHLNNQGNGIGLSMTYDYVQLLGGTIRVDSQENNGTNFQIKLPLQATDQVNVPPFASLPVPSIETTTVTPQAPLLLLVDDDEELIYYLEANLKQEFSIEHACDAQTAWSKTLALHPALIISDIQMPGDSGITLAQKIRSDSRTHHIPVILLTAHTDPQMHVLATEMGASDYLTKPFHFQLLKAKIKNLLKQKAVLEKTYKKQLDLIPSNPAIESEDEKFLRKATKITEDNLSNTGFSVEELANALHISRVGLYKRLLALNGHTPTEFIRNIRLRHAALLLAKSNLTVAEIAYKVGFNNPKQFSKYFKLMYNVLPSVYKQHI